MGGSRNWAGLPPELLVSIADSLPVPDYVRFPAVCSSWASSVRDLPPKPPSSSHFPWLVLTPPKPSISHSYNSPILPSPTDPITYINLPENHRLYRIPVAATAADIPKFYIGYRDGWLVSVLPDDSILIVNPLTSATSRLPSILPLMGDPFHDHVDTIVLSASPGSGSFLALIVCGDHLSFVRPGDSEWTPLHTLHHYIDDVNRLALLDEEDGIIYKDVEVKDAVYHDGKFFATFTNGDLLSFDLSGPSPVPSVLISTGLAVPSYNNLDVFLVSAPSGDLLRVTKLNRRPKIFDVVRFDPDLHGWTKMDDLGGGDWSLFLDRLGSVVLSDMPGLDGNHIFYEDSSHSRSTFKVGVYDFGKGTVEAFFPEDTSFDKATSKFLIWFRPSLS